MPNIDPTMKFESFVIGPENRLAWEAARTTAESPGAAYNPLFIYSDTGLGKTHLLAAIANRAKELLGDVLVVYTPVEKMLRDEEDGSNGESEYRGAEILLVDDLQFLGQRRESHERLFHLLDHLLLVGKQVVLASDRPPLEMGDLDDRLLSRFSGGLVVDIGRPNIETRRAILELRVKELGLELKSEVLDAIARLAFENVRQLQGALNRVLATQQAEGRDIVADEVDRVLADIVADPQMPWLSEEGSVQSEFNEFLDDVSAAVGGALEPAEWREDLARAILKWGGEGYSTMALERYLDADEAVDATKIIEKYERDIQELDSLAGRLGSLDATALGGMPLKDPEFLPKLREVLAASQTPGGQLDEFFRDREKVILDWPVIEDRLMESWDDGNQR